MTRLITYTVVCGFLFALLDWKVVQLTRLNNRDLLEWMHTHERHYQAVTIIPELILCAPAVALKPVFYAAAVSVEASKEEQDSILHAPKPTPAGFYHLPRRGQSWTFVSWAWWVIYWTPITLLWYLIAKRFYPRVGKLL